MSLEEQLEREWVKLNEYEMAWRAKRDSQELRDFESRPWSAEDQNAILDIVRFMSGAIERIELRQSVLFRITHSNLSTIRGLLVSLVIGAVVVLAFALYHKLVG